MLAMDNIYKNNFTNTLKDMVQISLGPCPQLKTYLVGLAIHSINTNAQSCGFFIFTSSSMVIT